MNENKIWGTEQPFEVPENYFEDFENRLKNKLNQSSSGIGLPKNKMAVIAPWIGMAAAFLILALAYNHLPEIIFPGKFNAEVNSTMPFNGVSPADIFTERELLEYISEKNQSKFDVFHDSIFFSGIEEEDMIYLSLFDY